MKTKVICKEVVHRCVPSKNRVTGADEAPRQVRDLVFHDGSFELTLSDKTVAESASFVPGMEYILTVESAGP